MAIPEGYEKLAVVGIAYKGEYVPGTAYKVMNAVYYGGSTYVALRDNPTGPPTADNSNWQYLAKGFVAALLSMITATDTSGIMGTAGADVGAQALIDAMASKMVSELVSNDALTERLADYIAKSAIVQTESTAVDTVPSSAYFKSVKDDINSNLSNLEIKLMNAVLQSVTVEARAASAEISVDVSNLIPDGYRIVDIRPRSSGANACFVSFMDWSGSAPKISYVVRNVTDERVTATPSAKLLLMPITTQ